jgi:hypothetical protein
MRIAPPGQEGWTRHQEKVAKLPFVEQTGWWFLIEGFCLRNLSHHPAWPGTSVQISFRQICGTQNRRESAALQDTGGVEVSRIALLSQEGSTIETAVEIVRGDERSECKPCRAQPSRVVPEPSSLRMHSETFRLRNHPSRHRKERDDAALLTQEGNSHAFTVSIILCAELIWTALPGQEGQSAHDFQLFDYDNSSSSALASRRSIVSNPSVILR